MEGLYLLMARLVYGAGLRLRECLRLQVKDLDFANGTLFVRSGKGDKDRTSYLPESTQADLRRHLLSVQEPHKEDHARGLDGLRESSDYLFVAA